jgi:hypothetical protein
VQTRKQELTVVEEDANALAVVHAADSLSEHVADLEDLQLGASRLVFGLIYRVRHNHLVKGASVDTIDSVSAQDAVGDERIHLRGAFLFQQLCRTRDGIGSIRQIVDEDCRTVRDVSDEHHGRILAIVDLGGAALLVNERKRHAERIRDSSSALGAAGVGTHNDGLLEVRNVELYVLAEEMAAVEVVDRDVEEALILRVCHELAKTLPHSQGHTMQIHSDNVVRTSAGQQIRDQRTRLSNPLPISDHGLKRRRLGGRLP